VLPDAVPSPAFDANTIFTRLNSEVIEQAFGSGGAIFDHCDPLGAFLLKCYPRLDAARRVECFRRLARTAVQYHRFALMDNVRGVFRFEGASAVASLLLGVLEQEDPHHIIHGWGAIPGGSSRRPGSALGKLGTVPRGADP
jgi:hypothetical protein